MRISPNSTILCMFSRSFGHEIRQHELDENTSTIIRYTHQTELKIQKIGEN